MAHIQVAGDTEGVVFGGLVNAPLQPTPMKKYQVKPFVCLQTDYCATVALSFYVLPTQEQSYLIRILHHENGHFSILIKDII
jgi:hypothetical protein